MKSSKHENILSNVVRSLFLLLSLFIHHTSSTGRGTIGIHVITSRYILVSDSLYDSLFVIDVKFGGVVGHLLLHPKRKKLDVLTSIISNTTTTTTKTTPSTSKNKKSPNNNEANTMSYHDIHNWIDPTGVSTCNSCHSIYATSNRKPHFLRIDLPSSLLSMAHRHDFTPFTSTPLSNIIGVPWNIHEWDHGKGVKARRELRMIATHHDGRASYVAHMSHGIYKFDPHDNQKSKMKMIHWVTREMIHPHMPEGVVLSQPDEEYLIVTARDSVYLINVNKPTVRSTVRVRAGMLCGNDSKMTYHFRDAALVDKKTIYVIGHPNNVGSDGNLGMVLYRIDGDDGDDWSEGRKHHFFTKCSVAAGAADDEVGWRDGWGSDVRFSRPHSMALMPPKENNGKNAIAITDCDNRAVRLAELNDEGFAHVSTISYDEDLWFRIYGDTKDKHSKKGIRGGGGSGLITTTSTTNTDSLSTIHTTPSLNSVTQSHSQSQSYCANQSPPSQLCSLSQLRLYWQKKGSNKRMHPITTWSSQKCHSCWIHYPGKCPAPSVKETANERVDGAAWGWEYRMVVIMTKEGGVKTECTNRNRVLGVRPVCCDIGESVES